MVITKIKNKNQLKQLVRAEKQLSNIVWPDINCFDEDLIDPSNWNSLLQIFHARSNPINENLRVSDIA